MSSVRLLAPELDVAAAARLISAVVPVRDRGERGRELAFLDTADRLLRAQKLDAVHEQGWLELRSRENGEPRGRCRLEHLNGPLPAARLSSAELAVRLRKVIGARALLPVVYLRLRARSLDVLDDLQKTVVRVELGRAEARSSPEDQPAALATSIQLHSLRGYEAELGRVRALLGSAGGVIEATEPLADEALRACGGNPAGVSSKVNVPLSSDLRADSAASAVLRRLLEVIEDNLEGSVQDTDPEFLHDFRVAVRRTRSVQRELKGIFPPAELARHRAAFRWLQQATGDVRDLDVHLGEFDELRTLVPTTVRPDLAPLHEVLAQRRERARDRLVADLTGRRTRSALREWAALLEDLVELPPGGRPDARVPIGGLIDCRVAKVYQRMVRMGREIDAESPAEALHELRKRGKELRYLLELFATRLHPEEVLTPLVRSLKSLQDVLGRHQDRQVQIELILSLADEVAEHPGGPKALLAMGALLGALDADEQAARRELSERFGTFSAPALRQLVKASFR